MNVHDATEIAYQNGYEQGQKDAVMLPHRRLTRLLGEAIAYGLAHRDYEFSANELAAQYLLDHGVMISSEFAVPVYTEEELTKKYGKKGEV